MKISFSTLGCPNYSLEQAVDMAVRCKYDGMELRFIKDDAVLWKRPEFQGAALKDTNALLRGKGIAISCVDTGCEFHSPDAQKRRAQEEEALRYAELASHLGSPGIRVFGNKVAPGADAASTKKWISESLWRVADKARPMNVEVWVETHGDFTKAADVKQVLSECGCHGIGAVWDPANAVEANGEDPGEGATTLGAYIRHVHFKDLLKRPGSTTWEYVLMGQGNLGVTKVLAALKKQNYSRFVSYEWEKKWHPEIPGPEVALPQFAEWIRSQ
jgi:sugar phosphate isomerase/epimerase